MLDSCCCKNKGIGFANAVWPAVEACFVGTEFKMVPDISLNPTLLDKCVLVFLGLDNACGNAPLPIPAATIRSYLLTGGRVWLAGEFGKDPAPGEAGGTSVSCLQNQIAFNQYLSDLGSDIIINDDYDHSGAICDPATALCTSEANLTSGLFSRMAVSATLVSGDALLSSPLGNTVLTADFIFEVTNTAVNGGWLFVAGDSNFTSGCGFDNCELFRRMATYTDAQIL
jgi:hypothetical protein